MRVSTAARRLEVEERFIYQYCRKLGIKKTLVDYGYTQIRTYEISDSDFERIKKMPMYQMNHFCAKYGFKQGFVHTVLENTSVELKETERLLQACSLKLTGEYTWLGINKRLARP